MTLIVRAFGAYRAEIGSDWRPQDWLVRNLVKSLKGEPFKGFSNFKLGDKPYTVKTDDPAPARMLFGWWASRTMRNLKLGKITLVPVPSSAHVQFKQDTCPVRMATVAAEVSEGLAEVGHFLRYKEPQKKAHSQGGSRNQQLIEDALDCQIPKKARPVVLVDDVITTGAHLRACAEVLRRHGATVENVLVAGRTVWEAVPDPYKVQPEDIEAMPSFGNTVL